MRTNHLLIAILVLLASAAAPIAWAGPGLNPDHIHFSWQQDPSTTITAVWRTDASITDSVMQVRLGANIQEFSGSTHTYAEQNGILHIAEATGLAPKTEYDVMVGDGGGGHNSDWHPIKTAPAGDDYCEPFRFVVMGDSRSSIDEGASLWWSTILDSLTDDSDPNDPDPDFLLLNGDLVQDGEYQTGWDDWFDEGGSDLAAQPILPVWGNHDEGGNNIMLDQFALPVNSVTGTEDFFSVRYGSALFLALDTESTENRYPVQADWMQDEFDAHSDAIWKFAYHHRPAYSSGSTHGSEPDVQDYWVPVFEANHLDADWGSHDHIYQRTCFISQDQCVSDPADGTLYYVTGGAGAVMNPVPWPLFAWFSEHFNGVTYHGVVVEVEFNVARFSAWAYLDYAFDQITIEKPEYGYPTAAFAASAAPFHAGDSITFDGSGSIDPCGEIIDWTWNFGDGGMGNGEVVLHSYDQAGDVTVTLTVTDLDGYTDVLSVEYEVLPGGDDDDDDDDDDDNDDDDNDDNDDNNDDDNDDATDDDDGADDDDNDDAVDDDDSETPDDDFSGDDDDDEGCCG